MDTVILNFHVLVSLKFYEYENKNIQSFIFSSNTRIVSGVQNFFLIRIRMLSEFVDKLKFFSPSFLEL